MAEDEEVKCEEISEKLQSELSGKHGLEKFYDRSAISGLFSSVYQICDAAKNNREKGWTTAYEGLKASFEALFNNVKEKLDEKLPAQQSGMSGVAVVSTLGPAAGIEAGLGLFPLLSRMTRFLK